MARTAEDYGVPGLSDAVLAELAGNVRRYGQKGRFASQELGQRRGLQAQANQYRAALEQAAYSDAGRQYGQGIGQISNYLAQQGPLADSGAGTALRRGLASNIYGAAAGRIGSQYAGFLGQSLQAQQAYRYQRALAELARKRQRTGIGGVLGGIAGTAVGALAGGYGSGLGARLSGYNG